MYHDHAYRNDAALPHHATDHAIGVCTCKLPCQSTAGHWLAISRMSPCQCYPYFCARCLLLHFFTPLSALENEQTELGLSTGRSPYKARMHMQMQILRPYVYTRSTPICSVLITQHIWRQKRRLCSMPGHTHRCCCLLS